MYFQNSIRSLSGTVRNEDIQYVINAASGYSPWSAETVKHGYLTASGGHRIGICGVGAVHNGMVTAITQPTSLCLRVARDFSGISAGCDLDHSMLIIGPPGSGKTTLLRDLIRQKSNVSDGCIAVIDERTEIFPIYRGQACFTSGNNTDIMSGVPKSVGVEAVLRNMNPMWIAVDEITAQSDCDGLIHAGWCGVNLLATAHAGSLDDLIARPVYKPLITSGLFATVLILSRDKSWRMERLTV